LRNGVYYGYVIILLERSELGRWGGEEEKG